MMFLMPKRPLHVLARTLLRIAEEATRSGRGRGRQSGSRTTPTGTVPTGTVPTHHVPTSTLPKRTTKAPKNGGAQRNGARTGGARVGESPVYPGDFRGALEIHYAPHPDGEPDPGEIVWAWVPYEEDHSQGKDRPVLLIGWDDTARGGPWLLGLQLTSKDHDRDYHQERRAGRLWVDIGSGAWDHQGRPSEVRVNRILRVHPDGIRREGAVLAEPVFERVATAVKGALPS